MFSTQRFGGITKYFCEIFKRIMNEHEVSLSVLISDNYYLEAEKNLFKTKNILPGNNFMGKRMINNKIALLNKIYSRHKILNYEYDVLHPTFYDSYFLQLRKKPFVITVHDLTLFKLNYNTQSDLHWKDNMRKIIKKASKIISVSQNTKSDLVNILGISCDKIDVIYHGYNRRS